MTHLSNHICRHVRRAERRTEAIARQAARDKRTALHQVQLLDLRPGEARHERERLQIRAAKESRA